MLKWTTEEMSERMKIAIVSLGCAKNLVDTENLLGILNASNQTIVSSYEEADAIIINTCGFIESAKEEAISTILDAASYHKKLIVMGCLAQRYKEELEKEMPEVDRFIAIEEYPNLGEILSEVLGERIINDYGKTPRILSGKPWMAYLRIADGCDNKCSYCAIPLIRGPMRSSSIEEIVSEAKRFVQEGVQELTLIAQDTSRYGYDWDHKLHLSTLLKQLDQIEGVKWIRILYLYPDEIPDDLLDTIEESNHILPYFDIPIQHGNLEMLKKMNRRSNPEEILERTSTIRKRFPNAILRTTLITGFPGETKAQHEENLALLKQVQWDHLGVFTYSKEEDTPSYELEDTLSQEEKNQRKNELMDAQEVIMEERRRLHLGEEAEVLVEEVDPLTGMYVGRSYHFAPDGVDGCVRFQCEENLPLGCFVKVQFTKAMGSNLIGKYLGRI